MSGIDSRLLLFLNTLKLVYQRLLTSVYLLSYWLCNMLNPLSEISLCPQVKDLRPFSPDSGADRPRLQDREEEVSLQPGERSLSKLWYIFYYTYKCYMQAILGHLVSKWVISDKISADLLFSKQPYYLRNVSGYKQFVGQASFWLVLPLLHDANINTSSVLTWHHKPMWGTKV